MNNSGGRTKNYKPNRNKNPGRSHGKSQKQLESSNTSSSRGHGDTGRGREERTRDVVNQNQSSARTFKRNGEKGAESHTVSEAVRIRLTKLMLDLRENESMNTIEMSSDLSNTERKFLHELASQLGLKSKSSGKGEDRRITITKVGSSNRHRGSSGYTTASESDDLQLPILNMGPLALKELSLYITNFPPTDVEEAEAIETGSSIWKTTTIKTCTRLEDEITENNKDGDGDNNEMLLNTLKQLNIKAENEISSKRKTTLAKHSHLTSSDYIKKREAIHHALQRARMNHPNHAKMQKQRSQLPAFSYQKEICDIISKNTVTILSGDTGCGKSTQVPQFLLDDAEIGPSCSIVVTQPRRISAISIAERIADERCEEVGTTVGYNVRLESCSSKKTQLLFVTPGVLLRRFQSDPGLNEFTHIIIDEIHERDKYTEFLMIALRELLNRRSDLSVILMSATIQTNELMEYWSSAGSFDNTVVDGEHRPAEINIPGRTFPVQEFFLEEVLNITGFVNDSSKYYVDPMDDVDANLATLLGIGAQSEKEMRSNLVCIICNKSGFKTPEELGSHVAMCTGGETCGLDALGLEDRVRQAHISIQSMNENCEPFEEEEGDAFEEEDQIMQLDDDDDDDNFLGLRQGRWDGTSPFVADNLGMGNMNTLTEEEMLNRYQTIHDDQLIDNELIVEIIIYICKSSYGDGSILIFLPGWQEISELMLLLETNKFPFGDKSKFLILPLHSGIPSKEQRFVFQQPRYGVRKIVLATNIAETSITIDDVAFVIDSGRAKEKNYDPHLRSSTLQPVWISKASAKQRKGRAGRTKAGVCFHLYSRRRHESLRDFLDSELLRTSLEEIVLHCKKLKLAPGGAEDDDGVPAFLSAALTPPHPRSVTNAIESLVDMGAIDGETNDLTQLGQCLSMLSLEPRVGKMLIWSYIIGVVKDAAGMAVAMSYKSPFILPPPAMRRDAESKQVWLSNGKESDQITVLNVLNTLNDFSKKGKRSHFHGYCKKNYINTPTIIFINDLRSNLSRELKTIGFEDPNVLNVWYNRNQNKNNVPYLQAAIAAGLYPNIAYRQKGEHNFNTLSKQKAKIHLSSVNSCNGQPLSRKSQMLEHIVYGELVKGISSYTLSQTTHLSSVLPIILLCGKFRVRPAYVKGEGVQNVAVVCVDEEIIYQCEERAAFALAVLRRRLDDIVVHIVSNPSSAMKNLSGMQHKTLSTVDVVLKSAFQSSPRRC